MRYRGHWPTIGGMRFGKKEHFQRLSTFPKVGNLFDTVQSTVKELKRKLWMTSSSKQARKPGREQVDHILTSNRGRGETEGGH
ncbi:unnamed protein product [Calypogeia fissa]